MNNKSRVEDFGEVFTKPKEVKAMLNLVEHEISRIDSRFLEPACGTGNFLIEILENKIKQVNYYKSSQLEFERYMFLAISSIYGIDLLEDNTINCRNKLFEMYVDNYTKIFKQNTKTELTKTIKFVLSLNIVFGDALKLTKMIDNQSIIFSEWSFVKGSLVKRIEYKYSDLIAYQSLSEGTLFSDLGDEVILPKPIKEYKPIHFLELSNVRD